MVELVESIDDVRRKDLGEACIAVFVNREDAVDGGERGVDGTRGDDTLRSCRSVDPFCGRSTALWTLGVNVLLASPASTVSVANNSSSR